MSGVVCECGDVMLDGEEVLAVELAIFVRRLGLVNVAMIVLGEIAGTSATGSIALAAAGAAER